MSCVQFETCFNSTLVQLKVSHFYSLFTHLQGFNSTLVQLKADQSG